MTITTTTVLAEMEALMKSRSYSMDKWKGARFQRLKESSPTDKGNLAEDLLCAILNKLGYWDVEGIQSRRGDWDVTLCNGETEIRFEVKVATQDISTKHQFNGVREDRDYTHLFLLGVMPNDLKYEILAKNQLRTGKYHLTLLARGTGGNHKLTRPSNDLKSFDEFATDIATIAGEAIAR